METRKQKNERIRELDRKIKDQTQGMNKGMDLASKFWIAVIALSALGALFIFVDNH